MTPFEFFTAAHLFRRVVMGARARSLVTGNEGVIADGFAEFNRRSGTVSIEHGLDLKTESGIEKNLKLNQVEFLDAALIEKISASPLAQLQLAAPKEGTMNTQYTDITSKLGVPKWWDEAGVPRYDDFTPHHRASVYADQVALMDIECQNCGTKFNVCLSWSELDRVKENSPSLVDLIQTKEIHYGDPPNNGCCMPGPTMNSVPIQVIEFWARNKDNALKWERDARFEVDVKPEWAK